MSVVSLAKQRKSLTDMNKSCIHKKMFLSPPIQLTIQMNVNYVEEDINDNFTKRHENSNAPFIVKW